MTFINSKNEILFQEVSNKTKLEYIEYYKWACIVIDDNLAKIYFVNSIDPYAGFTHELLHIKYHHYGLKRPKYIDPRNLDQEITFLFNQLSHHKFYNEFCSLGFSNESFLQENKSQIDNLELDLSKLEREPHNQNNPFQLLNIYLALKSPHDNSNESQNKIRRLKVIDKENVLETVDQILEAWINESTYNSCEIFAKLFKICNQWETGFYLENANEAIFASDV